MKADRLASAAKDFIMVFADRLRADGRDHFADALKSVETKTIQRGPLSPLVHPTLDHLVSLKTDIQNDVILKAVESLDWGQLYEGGGIDQELADGMFAAQAAGTYGVFEGKTVATGLFLLAPNVHYPLHTHAAREVYHCLAGEIDITHGIDGEPVRLLTNHSSETPSGRLHALQTRAQPVLLAYIWTGDLTAPTWWWEQNTNGNWQRTSWERIPGECWKAIKTEPVDAMIMSEAQES